MGGLDMDDKELIRIQQKIIPEVLEMMELRYELLSYIRAHQPIGRRNLANELSLGERQVRNEIEFFNKQNFVLVERQGISLTSSGEQILGQLKEVMYHYKNLEDLIEKLREKLGIKKVFIVPGDSQKNKTILEFMGKTAANYTISILKNHSIIAVTGGSGVAAVARNFPEVHYPNITVLSARGGIGRSHSTQANSIVSMIGNKLDAQQEVLHLPDNIDKDILNVLRETPDIKDVFCKFNDIDILIQGIGRADVMAQWRNLPQDVIKHLKDKNAVAETFGHFINENGQIVCPSSNVGINIDQYLKIPTVVAIAGGKDKAIAIKATCNVRRDLILITDESAANEIINN